MKHTPLDAASKHYELGLMVQGEGRRYLIAILTSHDPSESYGIATTERISSIDGSELGSPRVSAR